MTSEDLPRRKKIRLEGYDYSANGLYFVTICVTEKYQVLWENVGANTDTFKGHKTFQGGCHKRTRLFHMAKIFL